MKWVLIVALSRGGVAPIGDYLTEDECLRGAAKAKAELWAFTKTVCVQAYILEPARLEPVR